MYTGTPALKTPTRMNLNIYLAKTGTRAKGAVRGAEAGGIVIK
jgi:hypothetical protein